MPRLLTFCYKASNQMAAFFPWRILSNWAALLPTVPVVSLLWLFSLVTSSLYYISPIKRNILSPVSLLRRTYCYDLNRTVSQDKEMSD